jgi:hypothetical protein
MTTPVTINGQQQQQRNSSIIVPPFDHHDDYYHTIHQQLLDNVAYDALVWASLHGLLMGDKSYQVYIFATIIHHVHHHTVNSFTFSSNFIAYFVIYCHSDFYEFAVIPNMHSLTLMPSLAKSHCHCHEVSQYNNEHRDFAKFIVNSTVNKLGLEQKRKRRKV